MAELLIVKTKAVLDACDTVDVSTTLEAGVYPMNTADHPEGPQGPAYTVLVRKRPSVDGTGHTCWVCMSKMQSTKYLDISAFNNY